MPEESSISEEDLEKALKDAGMTEEEFSDQVPSQQTKSTLLKKSEADYENLAKTNEKTQALDQDEIDKLLEESSKKRLI
ncbi:hypothetical protein KKI22_03225 [Patescibacteria group bacterium]|nr:hypothetical protein [Patescibacteria group bacterium]